MRNLAALNPQTKLLLGAVATLGLFVFLLSGSGSGGMPPPKSRYERTLDYDRPLSPSPPRARSSPSSSQHDAEKTTGGESEPDDGDWSAEEVAELRASMDQLNEETKRLAKEDKALRQELAQVRAAMLQLTTAKVKLPAVCEELWMTDVDRRAFVGALTDRMVRQYIEWGGGGSTLCASALVANVTTIEHNAEWCAKLKQRIKKDGITNVNIICTPVEWKYFGDTAAMDGTYEDFAEYVDAVDHVGIAHYDAVFIDGRARTACAKKALGYIGNDSLVMLHDWQREHYQGPVMELYDQITMSHPLDVLTLLKKKS